MTSVQHESRLSLLTPEAMQCPFHAYDALREEAPVYLDLQTGHYVVTRFEDIRHIAGDPETFSNRTGLLAERGMADPAIHQMFQEEGFVHLDTLVTADPPTHTHYRALVEKAFNLLKVREAEAYMHGKASGLIDAFPEGPFDFIQAFSVPLPVMVIARQLGVQGDEIRDFKRWSDALIGASNVGLTAEQHMENARSIIEMHKFFKRRMDALRIAPDDTLISVLVHSKIEGQTLSDRELVSLLQQLLVAGNETTTNTMAAAVLRMAEDPVLQQRLRENPELMRGFIEEVLRLDAPLQGLFRRATRAVTVGGVELPEGAIINLRWGSGNRDGGHYQHPEQVDLERKGITHHLAFGYGIHFCVGNQLARAELRIGLNLLLARSREIQLAAVEAPIERISHFVAYGLSRLMLDYKRA
jgi:cytochrome P450